jgi:wyosine [tRNA(Phe)-imidazoG37] synthetase (radical SAM superfamily)
VKVDAVEDRPWRRTDRPHRSLRLVHVLAGIKEFASSYTGTLATETMLIKGRNTAPGHLAGVARFVAGLDPAVAYLAVPTRPPTVPSVVGADEAGIAAAYAAFTHELDAVELLTGSEGDAFSKTGDIAHDLLSITAVHPMREDAVEKLVLESNDPTSARNSVDQLVREEKLVRTEHGGQTFYLRKLGVR